jgi:hypothetical protein
MALRRSIAEQIDQGLASDHAPLSGELGASADRKLLVLEELGWAVAMVTTLLWYMRGGVTSTPVYWRA